VKFRPCPVPSDLLAAPPLARIDYADCYGATLDAAAVMPPVDLLARLFFSEAMPGWVRRLLALRDRVAARTVAAQDDWTSPDPSDPRPVAVGDRIGPWKVASRSETEIVFLEREGHLDFAFSLRTVAEPEGTAILATTLVEFHGLPGKAYFLPVRPIHRFLVPRHMDSVLRAAKRQPT
jgi:hypothetical protein